MTRTDVRSLQATEPSDPTPLYVEWDDPQAGNGGWVKRSKAVTLHPMTFSSVGWVLRWDPHLVIAASVGTNDDQTVGDYTAVPWSLVREARWLTS